MNMKPIVMVSSTIDGFEDYRQAAKAAIEDSGFRALLVNEDNPSLASSSRNACLDSVESADILLVICGDRGGWVTPSGKTVVEEEYEHAQKMNIPILYFSIKGNKDDTAQRMHKCLSDYVKGLFRKEVADKLELTHAICPALEQLKHRFEMKQNNPKILTEAIANDLFECYDSIHCSVFPTRAGELFDPLTAPDNGSETLLRHLLGSSSLFNITNAKRLDGTPEILKVAELDSSHQQWPTKMIYVNHAGLLHAQATISSFKKKTEDINDQLRVYDSDILSALEAVHSAAVTTFEELDPNQRFDELFVNYRLNLKSYLSVSKSDGTQLGGSFFSGVADITAFSEPKALSRSRIKESNLPSQVLRLLLNKIDKDASGF